MAPPAPGADWPLQNYEKVLNHTKFCLFFLWNLLFSNEIGINTRQMPIAHDNLVALFLEKAPPNFKKAPSNFNLTLRLLFFG